MKFKVLLVFGLIMLFASAAMAASLPQISSLGTMSNGQNFKAADVAVASSGNAYVADWYNKSVDVFGYQGNFIKRMVPDRSLTPFAVAVDASGKVYVGLSSGTSGVATGAVKVYDANLGTSVALGSGLKSVSSIAVDAAKVYVADSAANAVRIYDINSKALLMSITSVSAPAAVAVSATGDVVVLDRPSVVLGDGATLGSRGQVFASDGSLKATLFSNGPLDSGAAVVSAPGGAAVDGQGRIYVSDASGGELQVYDATGAYLGRFDLAAITQNGQADGMAIGTDGRLLVAEPGAVAVLGVDAYTALNVTPAALDFSSVGCSSSTGSQNLYIANNGSGSLAWTLSSDSAWIVPDATSGSINGSGTDSVGVSLNTTGLTAGSHTGHITVSGPGASVRVAVTVNVASSVGISASPKAINLGANSVSSTTAPLTLTLGTDASWTATADQGWVQISPASGTTSGTMNVSANSAGMATGIYTANITIAAGCSADTVVVPVKLTVVVGAAINVTTNVAGASYTITGPNGTMTGSGSKSFTVGAGTYTVAFNAVKGYKTPAPVTQTLADGGALSVNGTYQSMKQTNQIIVSEGVGPCAATQTIKAFSAKGIQQAAYAVVDYCVGDTTTGYTTSAGIMNTSNPDLTADLIVANVDGDGTNAYKDTGMADFDTYIAAFSGNTGSVATADFDLDGLSDIVLGDAPDGSGEYAVYSPTSSGSDTYVNQFDGTYDSGCGTAGTSVAAGDVDGDGIPEIITACASGANTTPEAIISWVDTSGGPGSWTVSSSDAVDLGPTVDGVQLAVGDVDGLGMPLIIASTVPSTHKNSALIQMLTSDNVVKHHFTVSSGNNAAKGKNVSIAAGDVNGDAKAEVVIGQPNTTANAKVTILQIKGNSGKSLKSFKPFGSKAEKKIDGTRVSIGKVVAQ